MNKEELIAGKLYDIREATKSLLKDYDSKVRIYISLMESVMKANDCSATNALIIVSKTPLYRNDSEVKMLYISATVEIMTR